MIKNTETDHYVVALGASAGGLDPLTQFFRNMPTDTGMVFVVIQHLSPDYESVMDKLLQKITEMPVNVVTDGMRLKANQIYLIPKSHNMTLNDDHFSIVAQERKNFILNLPIDLFFESLAKRKQQKSIGIILSGTGSDGTRGARALKEFGGLVIAQNQESAAFSGMPKSIISSGLADYILDVEVMPSNLIKYIQNPNLALKNDGKLDDIYNEALVKSVFSALKVNKHVDFSGYKRPTLLRRLQRRMSISHYHSLEQYADFLKSNSTEAGYLFKELLIGVTNFFRDNEIFDEIQHVYLKEYLQNAQGSEVRFWVAGCSTGEEAYSYGIIFLELCEKYQLDLTLKIFATDIDEEAIAIASRGEFPESVAADIPSHLLHKYFKHSNEKYKAVLKLREKVVFARHDITVDPPFTNIDLVSCRNLLIYLNQAMQFKIIQSFNFSLKPGGLFIQGSSESLGNAEAFFTILDRKKKIYRSLGAKQSMLKTLSNRDKTGSDNHDVQPLKIRETEKRAHQELQLIEAYLNVMAGSFLPFSLIVNEDYDVIRLVGDSGDYIQPLTGLLSNNVSKLVIKELSVPVMSGLSRLFRQQEDITFTNVRVLTKGKEHFVNVVLKLIPLVNAKKIACVCISSPHNLPEGMSTESYDIDDGLLKRVEDLEHELQFTRENLQATIEEMETSNEELQAANEELLASNEELQSTNEQLQSVNEELFSVNSEHQNKVSEMSELNMDMDNLLSATRASFVFLDEDLKIRRFSSHATMIFNIIEHDIGRPFSDISDQIKAWSISEVISAVANNDKPYAETVEVVKRGRYVIQVLPYKVSEKMASGILILATKEM
jgi:two-component system CheB/CheR fusion protein